MPRKTNLDVMLGLASKLPWHVSLALAPVSYVACQMLAKSLASPKATDLSQISEVYVTSVAHVFASVGQVVLPMIFIAGSLLNFIQGAKASKRFERTAQLRESSALLDMNWKQFETTVAEYFRRRGFKVSVNGQSGPDGGVDIELRKGVELSLVQCKQWRATQVGVAIVRELYGVMAARGATAGFVVSAGTFTADAAEFVIDRNITLINGQQLIDSMSNVLRNESDNHDREISNDQPELNAPGCPSCGRPMVKRTASRGSEPGKMFWGCTAFPRCRGTRQMT